MPGFCYFIPGFPCMLAPSSSSQGSDTLSSVVALFTSPWAPACHTGLPQSMGSFLTLLWLFYPALGCTSCVTPLGFWLPALGCWLTWMLSSPHSDTDSHAGQPSYVNTFLTLLGFSPRYLSCSAPHNNVLNYSEKKRRRGKEKGTSWFDFCIFLSSKCIY